MFVHSRRSRGWRTASAAVFLLVGALVLTSCGASASKSTSARRTEAMPHPNVHEPVPFEPAFESQRLRTVDPCALLRGTNLAQFGRPGRQAPDDLGSCAQYVHRQGQDTMSLTLNLSTSLFQAGQHNVAGLPVNIRSSGDTCTVQAAYHGSSGGNFATREGLEVQVHSEGGDTCSPGVQLLSEVIHALRGAPPQRPPEAGALATSDPCRLLDASDVQLATGGAARVEELDLYTCEWKGAPSGVVVEARYEGDRDLPVSIGPPQDLGGVQGSVEPGPNKCAVSWIHRENKRTTGDELVTITVRTVGATPVDPCANALGAARAARAKGGPR